MAVKESDSQRGTVRVTRAVQSSVRQVWDALTVPEVVEKWFGSLSHPLRVGESSSLDFGDGDFFSIKTLRIDPPSTLEYEWRFLGTGPLDTITWNIIPADEGCLVTVTDKESGRTEEEAASLRKGWLDFTKRLEKFLRKGAPTRYPWRHEFDGSIELSGDAEKVWGLLFDGKAPGRWLPFGDTHIESGARFAANDGMEPIQFEILNPAISPRQSLRFDLIGESWLHSTPCCLSLSPRESGTLLSVSHNGWESISLRKSYQKEQRKRFCDLWVEALNRAGEVVEKG